MANNIEKFIKLINKRLDGHKVFNFANSFKLKNVRDMYKKVTNVNAIFENTMKKTRNHVTNSINNATIIQDLKAVPMKPEKPLPHRLVTWWQWYQQLVGLHTVEKCRQQVLLMQDHLCKCQEKRRYFRRELFIINNKMKEIYDELLRIKRDDPKYVSLTIMENKNLQEQTVISEKLTLLEEEEKDYFVQLTTAIKEYHDAQTMNSQRYKYISILASVIAAVLSLICSTIYNNKRIDDMRIAISEVQENNKSVITKCFNSLQLHVDEKLSAVNKEESQATNRYFNADKWGIYVISAVWILKGLIGF
ncbi:mitochondrial potassium channel-like [Vespa crabro]|uniref:mitochondrial potassium channel-like n=1 Tax=Vespa crabro TaxID=7445 RepID=UPI001F00498B|nr:mitochondrial potassium channel-like [Vespa crabro]